MARENPDKEFGYEEHIFMHLEFFMGRFYCIFVVIEDVQPTF